MVDSLGFLGMCCNTDGNESHVQPNEFLEKHWHFDWLGISSCVQCLLAPKLHGCCSTWNVYQAMLKNPILLNSLLLICSTQYTLRPPVGNLWKWFKNWKSPIEILKSATLPFLRSQTGAGEGGRQLKQLEHRQYFQYIFTFIQLLEMQQVSNQQGHGQYLQVLELQELRDNWIRANLGVPWNLGSTTKGLISAFIGF